MNWVTRTPILQTTTDGRYAVKFGLAGWTAFDTSIYGEIRELGIRDSDLKARGLCTAHEANLYAARKAG